MLNRWPTVNLQIETGVMKQPIVTEGRKSKPVSPVWNIRLKLITGFSILILVAAASVYTIWSQLQSVSKLSEELSSLNPLSSNIQYLANDMNAYLLGHRQQRQIFDQHANDFINKWQKFADLQVNHEDALPEEKVSMIKIRTLSQTYVDDGLKLFDSYDKQLLTQERLNSNVNKTMAALDEIIEAHAEYKSEAEVDQKFEALRVDIHKLVIAVQDYRLGGNNKEAISQLVTEFQNSMGFFFDHLGKETEFSDNYRSQVDTINADWLRIGGDSLNLIKLQDLINERWQAVGSDGDALIDLVTVLVDTHNGEIKSTRARSTQIAIFVIICVILIGIGTIIFIDVMISAPITTLFIAVREFGQGAHDYRVDVRSNDEIGELGHAFNQMADDITEYETELEITEKKS